ncbi:helix-turn-helix domain-containing protein [Alkaliphilus metalliredigens]|nr:helix-turn-helix transcriptional regulator [Alkaliphilus metalliredigens]
MVKRRLTRLGSAVHGRLVQLNMTQRELAKEIGTSEVYLSMILRGRRSGNKYRMKIVEQLDLDETFTDTNNH